MLPTEIVGTCNQWPPHPNPLEIVVSLQTFTDHHKNCRMESQWLLVYCINLMKAHDHVLETSTLHQKIAPEKSWESFNLQIKKNNFLTRFWMWGSWLIDGPWACQWNVFEWINVCFNAAIDMSILGLLSTLDTLFLSWLLHNLQWIEWYFVYKENGGDLF